MRILVIEDEKKLARFIKKGLEEQKYIVDVAYDGERGEFMAMTGEYDLILLDILLPGMDGWQICENIRKARDEVPIIMISALGQVSNRVRGLDKGADDYITKPFEFSELLARVRAQLRRRSGHASDLVQVGDLKLDTRKREVLRDGQRIPLTNREFALLEYLILHKDRVVTRTMIAEHVWDLHFDMESNVIDVIINYLRRKIEKPGGPKIIHTVRGAGYMVKDG